VTARTRWARTIHLTVVPRSPANPGAGMGRGQCWLDALDAANECGGCGRLPQEGCRCNVVELVAAARLPRRVAARSSEAA
jgi:hypothetical protein